jgi:hypothetical protein
LAFYKLIALGALVAACASTQQYQGVEPVPGQEAGNQITRARAWFHSGEIRIFDSSGNVDRVIPFSETDRRS